MKRVKKVEVVNKRTTTRDGWFRYSDITKLIEDLNAQGKYPSGPQISEALEINYRTLKKDFASMRLLGFPLALKTVWLPSGERHRGYYFTESPKHVFGFDITPRELCAMITAQKALQGTPFAHTMLPTLTRLIEKSDAHRDAARAVDDLVSIHPLAREAIDPATLTLLLDAALQRRGLSFRYRPPGESQENAVAGYPYHVSQVDAVWHVILFVPAENQIHVFTAHRLQDLVMTDETFVRPKNFDHRKYLRGGFPAEPGGKSYEVIVEFDRYGADVMSHQMPEGAQLTALPEGRARVQLCVNALDLLTGRVLQFGMHAEVHRPEVLKDRIREHLKVMNPIYFPEGIFNYGPVGQDRQS
jgi:predicted DNA-binding transcriptional regulator YafY